MIEVVTIMIGTMDPIIIAMDMAATMDGIGMRTNTLAKRERTYPMMTTMPKSG